jgi:hypothetical protein
LGTDKIIDDLQRLRGWQVGEVVVAKDMVKRDPLSNLIVGITA